jgi:hypothetical protein
MACGGASNSTEFDLGDGGNGNGNGNGGSSGGGSGSSSGGTPILPVNQDAGSSSGGNNSGCSAASQLVYVLTIDNQIYSFDPPSKAFTKISTLQCQADGMTPNSMAVDRLGNAWVNYVSTPDPLTGEPTSGAIYKVDIATGACTATNISLTDGWYQVGMGYSTASATDTTDTLYVTATNSSGSACAGGGGGLFGGGTTSAGLGTVDTTAGTLTPIGPFSGNLAGQSAELTGTGDGRLFGFFVLEPVEVAQIDKTSGATSNAVSMPTVSCPIEAWAFSFWGGDFYLYTSPDQTTPSSVTHYSTGDGGIDTEYVTNSGIVIVGAGVSTCAPTTQPPPQ